MKKLAVVLATLLVLSGCGATSQSDTEKSSDHLKEGSITLSDGRVVTCIIYKHGRAGGLSCDWEGSK